LGRSRILVAVSTPWASEKLVEAVRELAERLEATVVVAHVARPSEQDESDEDTHQRSEQTVQTLVGRLQEAEISAEGLVLYGRDVPRALLNAAGAQNATLMVLGFSARGRLARLFGGDAPQKLLRQTSLPVLLYPPDWSGTI